MSTALMIGTSATASEPSIPGTEGFERFKKDSIEAYYYKADIMSGVFVRGYAPVEKLNMAEHFGEYADQIHFFGQGIYSSGTQRWANVFSVDVSQYGFGGGIGGWTPLFESDDGSLQVAAIGNIGVRYASVKIAGRSVAVTGVIWDLHVLASTKSVPGLKFGFAMVDSGTGYGHDTNHIGPLHVSYDLTPKITAAAYLGSSSAIGIEYKF